MADIEPKGAIIAMDGYLTKNVVNKVQHIDDPEYREEMVDFNYEIGKVLWLCVKAEVEALVTNFTGKKTKVQNS